MVAYLIVLTLPHSGHVGGVMLDEKNILLGIELQFYKNASFCFSMQIAAGHISENTIVLTQITFISITIVQP